MNTKMLVVNSGKRYAVGDKTVRQAIGHMVNRDKIAKEIFRWSRKTSNSIICEKCNRH